MANLSYLDELDDDLLDDKKPYSSVSDREPLDTGNRNPASDGEDLGSLIGQMRGIEEYHSGAASDEALNNLTGHLDLLRRGMGNSYEEGMNKQARSMGENPVKAAIAKRMATKQGNPPVSQNILDILNKFKSDPEDPTSAEGAPSNASPEDPGSFRRDMPENVHDPLVIDSAPPSEVPEEPSPPAEEVPPVMPEHSAETPDEDTGSSEELMRSYLQLGVPNNLAQAVAQAAQGPQTPQINNALYSNMQKQREGLMKGISGDLDRRQKVAAAIANRSFVSDQKDKDRQNRLDAVSIKPTLTFEQQQELARIRNQGTENPRPSVKDYNSVNRSLEGIKAAQELHDLIYTSIPGKHSLDTGFTGKFSSYFGLSNPKVEQMRAQLKAMVLPIAVTMSAGNAPTDNMLKKVQSLMPDIDKDSVPVARGKIDAIMHKLFVDAEGPVKTLEQAKDGRAGLFRKTLTGAQKEYQDKYNQYNEIKPEKKILKKLYSPSRNKTLIIYEDGTQDEQNGKF